MSLAPPLAALAGACLAGSAVEALQARAERGGTAPRRPLTALLTALGRRVGVAAPRELPDRMEAAGLDGRRASDAMAVKTGAAAMGEALALLASGTLPGRTAVLALVVVPAAGYLLPDLLLRRRTERRAAALARELPDTLDLLRVAVQAGLTPSRAMGEVGSRATGLLAAELRDASRRIALGASRHAALDRLALRCPAPGPAALVAAIRRSERHGAPLAPTLAALAADARAERARVLREQAARAAPKIQLVVALALVPGVLLLVAAVLVPRVL